MINVFIVEDQPLLVDGILARFENDSLIKIVSFALTCKEALEKLKNIQPDVILIGCNRNEDLNCVELYKRIKVELPHVRTVLFSQVTSKNLINSFINEGVEAIRMKDARVNELREAIINANKGVFDHKFRFLNSDAVDAEIDAVNRSILAFAKQGLTYKEISENMCLSVSAIKSRVSAMSDIYEAKNITHLVAMAIENCWL